MNIEIRKYNHAKDYTDLMNLIMSEGKDWKEYLDPKYQTSLNQSITYVALCNKKLCGYSRSMNDVGYYLWVLELLVHKEYRGHSIGKKLMDYLHTDYTNQEVLIMSDVDGYYQKLGYKKEGSIFKVG
jgi:ribosomal protein S18 acetylase RimI-like enzyme